jgi:hypothetical protein
MKKLSIHANPGERGQSLIFFALSVPLLLGALALVLDAGWAFYTKKKAQTAVDAAALAAVNDARERVGLGGQPTCGILGCQSEGACPASGTLHVACRYAAANGFADGAAQTVRVAAGTTANAPGAPGIPVDYWVEVTARQNMDRWFVGLLTDTALSPAARATAALRRSSASGSLYLLNRKTDCFASALNIGVVCGEDFLALGSNRIHAPGGIYMASSNPSGIGLPNIAAGTVLLNVEVDAPFTRLMGKGGIQPLLGLGSLDWRAAPTNGFPDGDMFTDPMAGRGQPPAPVGLPDRPVAGGVIAGSLNPANPTLLPPGNYYSTLPLLGATGLPITILGNVVFSDGANPPCGGFCNYVFYGGVVTGVLSTVTFAPGRYVFAGAQPVAGGPGAGLSVGANAVLQDVTPLVNGRITRNSDAGEIFIFTDKNYPGLQVPVAVRGLSLPQARAGVLAGVNPRIALHGLNADSPALPAELKPFAPVVIWQDQANTTLRYTPQGRLDMSCGSICENILSVPGSQEMIIQASQAGGNAGTNFYGTIYGPRGSWLTILGALPGDTVAGPFQIISGALQLAVFASLDMEPLPDAPSVLRASLIR